MFNLTKGSLKKILDGETPQPVDPIIQIIQMKNIQNNQDGVVRYKVTLWDGHGSHTFGILATQKNHLVEDNSLKLGSVIRLEEFAANVLSKDPPKVVVILLNFEILGEMPINTESSNETPAAAVKPIQNENIKPNEPNTEEPSNAKKFFGAKDDSPQPVQNTSKIVNKATTESSSAAKQSGMFNGLKIFGIIDLNPYQNKWSIKVRVSGKSSIRNYTNAKGPGKVFSVDFFDSTGEIKANGFNEQCEKFYDMLTVDSVYYVSRGTLKTANKQYAKLNNDYEMTFGSDTVIEQCDEVDSIPPMNISLCPLKDICNKNDKDIVDIIGVIKSVGDLANITVKATGKDLAKRDLQIVDDSNFCISATLWGKQAEEFEAPNNPVILVKGAQVKDYNGKNLSFGSNANIQINPDIPESHRLRGWFDQAGVETNFEELSNTGQSGGGGGAGTGSIQSNWKTLDSLKTEGLGLKDKPDYITCKAIVLYTKKDNSMYMACVGENCQKKVVDQNDGQYRCEKCAKSYDTFKWRFVMSANIADYTESSWVTCFQDSSELILGVTAQALGALKAENDNKYDEYFSESAFGEYNFKLRVKSETYNDESRVKVGVQSCERINYVTNGRQLLQRLKRYAGSNV